MSRAYLLLLALCAMATAVLAIGLPLRRRFRRQRQYIAGLCAIAGGLVSFWVLPALTLAVVRRSSHRDELEMSLMMLALVVAGSILGGGASAVKKANNTARDDSYDVLFRE